MDDVINALDNLEDELADNGCLGQEEAEAALRIARNLVRALQSIGSDVSMALSNSDMPEG